MNAMWGNEPETGTLSTPTTPPPTTTTSAPTTPPPTSTTTNPSCSGECYWVWIEPTSSWVLSYATCSDGCGCITPPRPGEYPYESYIGACS